MRGPGAEVRDGADDEAIGAKINMLRHADGDLRAMVENEIRNGTPADQALDDHLEFVRNYAQFSVPSSLAAVAAIAREVLGDRARIADPLAFTGRLRTSFSLPSPRFSRSMVCRLH